jgi:hypothetical protein
MSDGHRAAPPVPRRPEGTASLRDGRYRGRTAEAELEVRVDGRAGVASADVSRVGPSADPAEEERVDWVASLRTAAGARFTAGDRTKVVAEDGLGGTSTGTMTVAPAGAPDRATATVRFDSPLNGLQANVDLSFPVAFEATALRSLAFEIETEEGVAPAGPVQFDGHQVTIQSCLEAAGFTVTEAGEQSTIPTNPTGWDDATLHTLMADFAQASLDRSDWVLHLLMLGRALNPKLNGVMFDTTEVLPRQGLAVFATTIRGIEGIDTARKLIQTSVHESGHALNLAHRFERVVGRADSTSFMNYDWRYKGGDATGELRKEFWERFAYTFDADELSFLRHGPRSAVIPGGDQFHSRTYWNEGTGGYSPYVTEAPLGGFELELLPPAGGRLFAFAQPVFLEVRLTNRTGQTVDIDPAILDSKVGLLELLVRRTHGTSARSLAGAEAFRPILQRCVDVNAGDTQPVPDGGTVADNVNLTYGSSGFPFAEPGAYEVTAVLAVPDPPRKRELILRSRPLPIRVAAPQSVQDDRDAMELFRDDVGVYFAIGGNRNLAGAHDTLTEIADRRSRAGGGPDPVVAAIVRAQAMDATRTYVRYQAGEGPKVGSTSAEVTDKLGRLEQLDDEALKAFDAVTARETRGFRDNVREQPR